MRKKKTYIAIILLLAVLLTGIAYASIVKQLNITGSATAHEKDDNFVVKFTGEPTTGGDGTTVAKITGDSTATIAVTELTTTGEKATATYEITNASEELSANLAANVKTNSNTTFFKVTPTIAKTSILQGEKTTVEVEVELIKTPIEEVSTNIEVEITATAEVAP